jgi:hypothetical protein
LAAARHNEPAVSSFPDFAKSPTASTTETSIVARPPMSIALGGRRPVLPFDVGEAGGDGAVPGQTDHDRDKAVIAICPRDMALAVRRVRQAMQQYHGAHRRTRGLQHT